MNAAATESDAKWLWADLVSSYSFWALVIVYVASSTSFSMFNTLIPALVQDEHLTRSDVAGLFSPRIYAGFAGLYLAWLAARWKPVPIVIAMVVLQLLAVSLLLVPSSLASPLIRIVAGVCWGLGYFTVLLAVPAILAGALGRVEGFVMAFGVALTLSRINQILLPALGPSILFKYAVSTLVLGFLVAPLLLAALAMAFVRHGLFQDPPRRPIRTLPPVSRSPLGVAFLSLVPLYPVYWFYRAHGEAASLTTSRRLLSPLAAVGLCFVPLMAPIMLTTLIDELNLDVARRGRDRLQSPVAVFLLGLFLVPVGLALVQGALNRVARSAEARELSVTG
jgi:hypothetical protein